MIFERNETAAFRGKAAASLSTSINFFDHAAHNYINAISDDLEMKFFGSYSAEMSDMHKSRERQRLTTFGELFIKAIKEGIPVIKNYKPLSAQGTVYEPVKLMSVETNGKKVLIAVDDMNKSPNLQKMVKNLQKTFSPAAELVQLKDVDIKGGCLVKQIRIACFIIFRTWIRSIFLTNLDFRGSRRGPCPLGKALRPRGRFSFDNAFSMAR